MLFRSQMGTPTINQPFPDGFVLPRFGVYASVVEIGETLYFGVTNVGVKPTVGSDCVLAETWIPDYRGCLLYTSSLANRKQVCYHITSMNSKKDERVGRPALLFVL